MPGKETCFSCFLFQTVDSSDGEKGEECQPQDACIVDFVGRLAQNRDDEGGPIFHEAKDCLIVIGEKYVNPALEMGVRFMHKGQSTVLWSHSKFAYGLSTRKWDGYELPPNSNVRYEITVKNIFSPKEESTDPDGFQLKLAMSKKLIANDMFKNELYNNTNQISEQRALRMYSKAADEMLHLLQTHGSRKEKEGADYKEEEHKETTKQASDIMLDCLNNVVAVYLKAKKYHEAKEAAVKVLTHDPSNFKALLRAARAAMLDPAGTYEESDAAIAAAEQVVEERNLDDKDVRKLRQELKQKKQEYKKRKKEMMARMTKELKPKEKSMEEESASQQQQSAPATEMDNTKETTQVEETAETENQSPLWRRVLPYAIQIIFPFVLYYAVVLTSKPHNKQHVPGDEEL